MILALILAVLVIFVFLHNVSATVIPSLALPMSLIGTFAVMYLCGYSLDNLSRMALTLCVGFVVDNAIVMLEILRGTWSTVKASWRLPIMDRGRSLHNTVDDALACRRLYSCSLHGWHSGTIASRVRRSDISCRSDIRIRVADPDTDALQSFSAAPRRRRHGRPYQLFERFFEGMCGMYETSLRWALHYRRVTLVVSILLIGVIVLYFFKPKGFFPSEDNNQIVCFTEAAEEQSLVEHQRKLAAIVAEDPNIDGFMSNVGAVGSTVVSNIGRMFIRLKPRKERSLSADEVIQKLRPKLAVVPGIRVFMQNPPPINVGGLLTKSQYQYTLQSSDMYEGALQKRTSLGGEAEGAVGIPRCNKRLADKEPPDIREDRQG